MRCANSFLLRSKQNVRFLLLSRRKRFYSTINSTGNLRVRGVPGNYRIMVPLPTAGNHVFTLPDSAPIRSFLDTIKLDDIAINSVYITDADGIKISKAMHTEDLIERDWKLYINEKVYDVKSPLQPEVGEHTVDVEERILDNPNFNKIKEYLISRRVMGDVLPYDTYLEYCTKELNMPEVEADEILHVFSHVGVVLYMNDTVELKKKIFLKPSIIASKLENDVELPTLVSYTTEEKIMLRQQLKEQLKGLEDKRVLLMVKATRNFQTLAWAGWFFLCGQFFLFARLVWWDYDWGVMEPVTWFTGICETTIAAYIYYLYSQSEYSHSGLRTSFIMWRFKRLLKSENFDEKSYEKLKRKIAFLEADLSHPDQPELPLSSSVLNIPSQQEH